MSTNYNFENSTSIPSDSNMMYKSFHFQDFVWIGFTVNLLPVVFVCEWAIISADSLVTKDVVNYVICVGKTAKLPRYRRIESNLKIKREVLFLNSLIVWVFYK